MDSPSNKFGKKLLVITNKRFMLFKTDFNGDVEVGEGSKTRIFKLWRIEAITIHKDRSKIEFLLHIKENKDYYFESNGIQELVQLLEPVFYNDSMGKNLTVYEVDKEFKKNWMKSKQDSEFTKLPNDKYKKQKRFRECAIIKKHDLDADDLTELGISLKHAVKALSGGHSFTPGSSIHDFKLLKKVGEGAYGKVYKCELS
jgi:hypothetical protein